MTIMAAGMGMHTGMMTMRLPLLLPRLLLRQATKRWCRCVTMTFIVGLWV
jgi:hypothetical protein